MAVLGGFKKFYRAISGAARVLRNAHDVTCLLDVSDDVYAVTGTEVFLKSQPTNFIVRCISRCFHLIATIVSLIADVVNNSCCHQFLQLLPQRRQSHQPMAWSAKADVNVFK